MPRLVLPFSFVAAIVGGLALSQMEAGHKNPADKAFASVAFCLKTGMGCSR